MTRSPALSQDYARLVADYQLPLTAADEIYTRVVKERLAGLVPWWLVDVMILVMFINKGVRFMEMYENVWKSFACATMEHWITVFKETGCTHAMDCQMMTSCSNMSYSLLHDDALMNVASILTLNQGCGAASHIGAFRKQHVHPYSTCTCPRGKSMAW